MSTAERDAFLREPRIAILITLREDGSPAPVPIWYEWDGARARIFTERDSAKLARIRTDARVCLTVAEPTGVPEAWVTIDGTASIENEGGFALAERLAPRYYSAEQAANVLPRWQAMADRWVVIVIEPRRITSLAPD